MSQVQMPTRLEKPTKAEIAPSGSWRLNPFSAFAEQTAEQKMALFTLIGLIAVVMFAYWNTLFDGNRGVWVAWNNPQYSFGWLIPLFTFVLLLMRWEPITPAKTWERWAGVLILLLTAVFRVVVSKYRINTLDMYSMVPMFLGAFMLVGGIDCLRWAGPPIAFLIFMFPLNMDAERYLFMPLKSVASQSSVYVLQTLGIEALSEGNVIQLAEQQLHVVDACSGLRMLTIFLALAVGLMMVVPMPWWQRAVIFLSGLPIAVFVNIVRIVVTALLYLAVAGSETIDAAAIEDWSHDMSGMVMVPIAMGLLYAELALLDRIFIEESDEPLDMGFGPRGSSLPI